MKPSWEACSRAIWGGGGKEEIFGGCVRGQMAGNENSKEALESGFARRKWRTLA